MAWAEQDSLGQRFEAVNEFLRETCPHWSLGTSYDSWVSAHQREAKRLVSAVTSKLQSHMRKLLPQHQSGRWEAVAVDGSDGACPRTVANQNAMGDTGQPGGIPQLRMTILYHLGLGLPWAFRVGPSSQSERSHLREMLDDLPEKSLLVADAGFIGYDLCREMIARKRHFLLRIGGNVHLLKTLGYDYETEGQTVYLWPVEQQGRREPPVKLRLIVLHKEGQQPIYLVTSVLDPSELTDEEASTYYQQRWGVEVCYRTVKQTLGHARLRSRTPENCYLEMTWALLGTWMLELMTLREVLANGGAPKEVSPAQARDTVRRVMRNASPRPRSPDSLSQVLGACRLDKYDRKHSKASRNYPRKKQHKPPKPPNIKSPTKAQLELAQKVTPLAITI